MESKSENIVQDFIGQWGEMGSKWGMSRGMAQAHALLMVADGPLSTDDIMEKLSISRGNANVSLRQLLEWKLIRRVLKKGERKEFFESEKDTWLMLCRIAQEKRKREIEPAIDGLQSCLARAREEKGLKPLAGKITELIDLLKAADFFLEKVSSQEGNKLLPRIIKMISQ